MLHKNQNTKHTEHKMKTETCKGKMPQRQKQHSFTSVTSSREASFKLEVSNCQPSCLLKLIKTKNSLRKAQVKVIHDK